MKARERVFWFHYNKPASKAAGETRVTIHWKGACRMVKTLYCDVPTWGVARKSQPYFIMKGKATSIQFNQDGEAYVS